MKKAPYNFHLPSSQFPSAAPIKAKGVVPLGAHS